MREHLATIGVVLRNFLQRELPSLGPRWREDGVLSKLSYQQRAAVEEHGWSTLADLDVAALLRVADSNWDLFRRRNLVKCDDRNALKEAFSVRNRSAHEAPGREPTADRVYRDLDTLVLLAEALAPGSAAARQISNARADALSLLVPAGAEAASEPSDSPGQTQSARFAPGKLVRVKARRELTGVITQVAESGGQLRLTVFHGQMTQAYFESQVELIETKEGEHVSAEELKARLTAAHADQVQLADLAAAACNGVRWSGFEVRHTRLQRSVGPSIALPDFFPGLQSQCAVVDRAGMRAVEHFRAV